MCYQRKHREEMHLPAIGPPLLSAGKVCAVTYRQLIRHYCYMGQTKHDTAGAALQVLANYRERVGRVGV